MLMKLVFIGLSLVILGREGLGIKFEDRRSNGVDLYNRQKDSFKFADNVAGSGDGSPPLETDDEDLTDAGSGDGSGSGDGGDKVTTTVPLTTKSLTPCEQLRKSAQHITMYPKCTPSGEFEPLQCHINLKECWCVDKMGREITGSRMTQPKVPDCVTGSGLKPCVFQLLRSKYTLLGRFEPHCTFDGEYEKIQCLGSACWCVDEEGIEQWGTKVYKPAVPRCPELTPKPTSAPDTDAPIKSTELIFTQRPPHKIPIHTHTHKKDDKPFIPIDEDKEDTSKPDDDFDKIEPEDKAPYDVNTNDEEDTEINNAEQQKKEKSPIVQIMTQPGLLAAVIGGAVVGLLCVILMVMFIVYRMRKKDEGSYPLEEQKYTNYSYMKAPDKEFYA